MTATTGARRRIEGPGPRRGMEGAALGQQSSKELYALLPASLRGDTMDLIDWISNGLRRTPSTESVVEELCQRLTNIGLPIDRYASSSTVLTAEHDAIGRVWVRGEAVRETTYVRPGGEDFNYLHSPFYEAATTGKWVELWLPETPDSRFGVVREFKDEGYVHYLCIPIALSNDASGWVTMATRAPEGFSAQHLTVIALIIPAIAAVIDVRVSWMTLDRLLRTYVGDEPHRAILAGNVKRGQVSTIRSAILFADMRDSTGHTAEISAVAAVNLFNDFFDNLVPPIESRNGEVLKYMGDGLLAIFRESKAAGCDAAARALAAAEGILANIAAFNAARPTARAIELGVALHYGEAAYGNVGSGLRLDFTVIGRDIGLASRIGGMNGRLGEPLLMSEAFVARLKQPVVALGAFAARGFSSPVAVYRPGAIQGARA